MNVKTTDDKVYDAMIAILKSGYMPTTRNVARKLRLRSPENVGQRMEKLAVAGRAVRLRLNYAQTKVVYLPAGLCFDKNHK